MDAGAVLKKLRFKDGMSGRIRNAPAEIAVEFTKAGVIPGAESSDMILMFVRNAAEFEGGIKGAMDDIVHDGLLWVAYPKGTSSIETDVNRDILWEMSLEHGIRPVAQVAVDDDWSAIRFRPKELVKSK